MRPHVVAAVSADRAVAPSSKVMGDSMGLRARQGRGARHRRFRDRVWLAALLLIGASGLADKARALELSTLKAEGLCKAVVLDGDIARDEADGFIARLVAAMDSCGARVVVIGRMPGGSVNDAVAIGRAIRAQEYVTAMRPDSICASACGLIYLGGVQRYWQPGANFIIHRPEIRSATPFRSVAESDQAYEALKARLIRYVASATSRIWVVTPITSISCTRWPTAVRACCRGWTFCGSGCSRIQACRFRA